MNIREAQARRFFRKAKNNKNFAAVSFTFRFFTANVWELVTAPPVPTRQNGGENRDKAYWLKTSNFYIQAEKQHNTGDKSRKLRN